MFGLGILKFVGGVFGGVVDFFKTPLGKYLLIGGVIAASYYGTYRWGDYNGDVRGFNSQIPVITKLAKTINDDRTAKSNKIAAVETKVHAEVDQGKKDLEIKGEERAKIVIRYLASPEGKKAETQCGLTLPSVKAINELLDTQGSFKPPEVSLDPDPIIDTLNSEVAYETQ